MAILQGAENATESMPQSLSPAAVILLIFGIVVLYGGITRSLIIAYKHSKIPELPEDEAV